MCSILTDALRSYRRQCDLVIKVVIDDHVNLGVGSGVCILFEGNGNTSNNTTLQGVKSKAQASFMCVYASKIDAYLNILERTSLMVQ